MTMHAKGTFEVKSWDEETYEELDGGGKLTRAEVTQSFTGDLEGEGSVVWLMCYRADDTAEFVGLQRVAGRMGDRSGSFVVRTTGTFDGREAQGTWTVVSGSGTNDMQGIQGTGGFTAPLGSEASITLDYEFE